MQKGLRDCLKTLDKQNLLLTVEKQVDPHLEIPAVMAAAERQGKAIQFNHVKGSDCRVVNNIFGTRAMAALAFETAPDAVTREWIKRFKTPLAPIVTDSSPAKEVVQPSSAVDLNRFPIVTHCSKDAGPFITAGIVVAKDPETGLRNVSVNRMQFKGKDKLGLRMMPPQQLGLIHERCEKKGRGLDIAVAIGNHPLDILAAATTLPQGQDEFALAGALRKEPLELIPCETVALEVPAAAEIILEGEVLAGVREPEGPFGDFMQYYVPVMDNHVFRVKAITHRGRPLYQTIQASSLEDTHYLGLSREAQIFEAVSAVSAVTAVSLVPTILGCVIGIRKRFHGEAKNVAAAAFGIYPWLKYCVVVDHDVDVFDMNDVWWAMATRSCPGRDLLLLDNTRGFPRDPFNVHQSKLGIDATAPLNQWEEFERKSIPGADTLNLADYL